MTSHALDSALNTDLGRFSEVGFVIIPDLLDGAALKAIHAAFDELGAGAVTTGEAITKYNERRLMLDERFLDVLMQPRLLEGARACIGDDLQLLAYDALETRPGMGAFRSWHADFGFFSDPLVTANSAVYLQDMVPEVGPLLVIPGSHRWGRQPSEEEVGTPHPEEVLVQVRAGTAVIFDSQLWHSGGRNESGRPRRALFPYFGHYWIKRMDDFYRAPLPDSILESDDPVVRQLFGLALAPGAPSPHGGYTAEAYE